MNRLLASVLCLALVLVVIEGTLARRDATERQLGSTVRPLPTVEEVRSLEIGTEESPLTWRYERREHWVFPAYHDVAADGSALDRLVDLLVNTSSTVITDRQRSPTGAHLTSAGRTGSQPTGAGPTGARPATAGPTDAGLTGASIVRLTVGDSTGHSVDILIGNAIPGPDDSEIYAAIAGADTLYHLHANPRPLLGDWIVRPVPALTDDRPVWQQAPFIDPRVLPQALARQPTIEVQAFAAGTRETPLDASRATLARTALRAGRLWLVETERPRQPGAPPEPPIITWFGDWGQGADSLVVDQAFDYVYFLARLRFDRQYDRNTDIGFDGATRLELTDAAGRVDVIEIGGRTPTGGVFLRHRNTGSVFGVAHDKASLLLPERRALVDSLRSPSPYQRAEPFEPRQ